MSSLPRGVMDIQSGDIFHAETLNGRRLICRAVGVTRDMIFAHTILTRYMADFDRRTGQGTFDSSDRVCRIRSVALLPTTVAATLVNLDRRHSGDPTEDEMKLSRAEIDALCMLNDFYAAHPLPA